MVGYSGLDYGGYTGLDCGGVYRLRLWWGLQGLWWGLQA